MKKLLIGIVLVLMPLVGMGESPFVTYQGEICDEGTDVFQFPVLRDFNTGMLIRLNIYGSPADTLADTVKVMLATRFKQADQSGTQGTQNAVQAWSAFTDSFLTATTDTATVELWFPVDSLMTGYDGTTLGDLMKLTFTTTDSLYSSVSNAWCDSLSTSLKWHLVIGYF